jgi:amicyanin
MALTRHLTPAHRRRPVGWISVGVLVAGSFLVGLAPGFVGPASAATRHASGYGPTNAKPAKKSVPKQTAIGRSQVKIANFKFGPRTLTVKVGTKVTWTNKDGVAHSVNFATGNINSKTLDRDAKFSHTFTTPGRYPYICDIHPFMHGTVVVTP